MPATRNASFKSKGPLTAKERRKLKDEAFVKEAFRRIDDNLKKIARDQKEIDRLRESTRVLLDKLRAG